MNKKELEIAKWYRFSWKNRANLFELFFFTVAGILMSTVTEDHSFVLPIYVVYGMIVIRNVYLFWKSRSHFVLYKILLYTIVIPDNYLIMVMLFILVLYDCIRYRNENRKKTFGKKELSVLFFIFAFLIINILFSEKLWINILFGLLYVSVFPTAYIFCRIERNSLIKNFENLVGFVKGLVLSQVICVVAFFVVNFHRVVTGIDNDWLTGTFGAKHGNILLFFMIFSIMIFEKHYRKTKNKTDLVFIGILLILSIFTNSIALTIMFFIAYLLGSIFKAKNAKTVFASIAGVILVSLAFFFVASPQWIQSYLLKFQDISFFREGIPKVVTYEDTFIKIPSKDTKFLLIGNGVGQFSSRGALITTGEYIREIDKLFAPSISTYTNDYILPRYKQYNVDQLYGTMYSPYSSIITIFGEYGVIGLIAFIASICLMIKKSKKEAAIFVIFFFLSCFVENYVEFAKVTVPLFLIYFIDRSEKR